MKQDTTAALWAAFPLAMLLLVFRCACTPTDYLSWWPWWIHAWKFGAGLCDVYSYRLYVVTLALAWLLHSAISFAVYAVRGQRAYLGTGLFWGLLAHMVWVSQ